MRRRTPAIERAWLGGLACAGVAAAHWAAYVVAPPHGHSHAQGLAATGHRFWPYLVALAVGAGVAAMSGFVADRLRAAPGTSGLALWRRSAARLVPAQVLTFFVLELVERVLFAEAAHSGGLLSEPVLWVGIGLQVVCAAAGAGLLVLFARTIELVQDLVARLRRPATTATVLPRPLLSQHVVRPLATASGGPTFRGPPALL